MATSAFGWLLGEGGAGLASSGVVSGAAREAASVDGRFMALALEQARRGVGRTAPNPPVGAVLVRDGAVLATGFHARAGERHAEVVAFDALATNAMVGGARGATLYVTLEPCTHQGRTPPCAERILAEGVARVVVGARDPNPRVSGGGLERLAAAGVAAELVGDPAAQAAAQALLAPFRSGVARQRPWVVLKVAATLDGRVAAAGGSARWITGAAARALGHELRDAVDAVMVGSGTVQADDPALTVRDAPARPDGSPRRNPLRVVVDSGLGLDARARVFGPGSLVLHAAHAAPERRRAFTEVGTECLMVGAERVALDGAMTALCARGVHSLLVEGGPRLATTLWQAGLVDELWWFTAPRALGADAVAALGPLGLSSPQEAPRLAVLGRRGFDDGDSLLVLGT